MSGEVRPGYKQTEVGVIPEDWAVVSLGSVAIAEGGYAFSSKKFLESGKYQVVKMSNLYGGELNLNRSASFLNDLDPREEHYRLRKNDIIITLTGTVGKRDYGYSYKITCEQNLLLNQRVARLFSGDRVNAGYLSFQLKTPSFLRQFFDSAKGGTGNQTNVGTRDIEVIKIGLPSLPEQEAIAEALSDADALIESLAQLIAKKRQIKQGAMQELFRPKADWVQEKLGNLAAIQRGASPRPIDSPIWFDDNSSIGWVRISDVTCSGMFLQETTQRLSPLGVQNSRRVNQGSLIMSICATVGRPIITQIETCIHDGFVVFDNLRASQKFLYYILKSIEGDWSKHGQTGSQMNLNTGLINQTKVIIPKTKDEQEKIAEVFYSMDAEIAALETKLAKARQLKQGMMHNLLTGRIRLV